MIKATGDETRSLISTARFSFGFINDGAEVLLPLCNEFKRFGCILNDPSFNLGVLHAFALSRERRRRTSSTVGLSCQSVVDIECSGAGAFMQRLERRRDLLMLRIRTGGEKKTK